LPSPDVLETLSGTTVLRTDHHGWIAFRTDGESLGIEVERMGAEGNPVDSARGFCPADRGDRDGSEPRGDLASDPGRLSPLHSRP
jgi:hypothetical protein